MDSSYQSYQTIDWYRLWISGVSLVGQSGCWRTLPYLKSNICFKTSV